MEKLCGAAARAWIGYGTPRENQGGPHAMLAASGFVCLLLCGTLFYKTVPRAGRPDSEWTRTEGRATTTAMVVLFLLFAGLTMLLTGLLRA